VFRLRQRSPLEWAEAYYERTSRGERHVA
jgi:hypothetical protein